MTDVSDPGHFSQPAVLRDGTPVLIRAIRPDDGNMIAVAFRKLDPQSVYTRFFSFKKDLSADEIERLETPDFVHAVVLVAAVGTGADEILIGGASYTVCSEADAVPMAELAFTIGEEYQGKGLSSQFLALLVEMARGQGIARFEADVLASNRAMLAVFERSGLPMTRARDEGVVHVVLDLRQDPSADDPPPPVALA